MTAIISSPIVTDVVNPAPGKLRIQALDVIRGLAILGILAVNADGFAAPQSASLKPAMWLFPNEGWTAISYWVMDTFFHEKFLTIFSMLFGVSLFLVGGDGSDPKKGRILARRLAILLLFGLLHGFGIWWGDILSLYAVTGFVMLFCRSWQPKLLMGVGVVLYAAMALSAIPAAAYPFASPSVRAEAEAAHTPDPAVLAERKAKTLENMAEAKASWVGAYQLNTKEYVNLLSGNPWLVPQTLALMMIGLSLFKGGFLAGKSSHRRYVVAIAWGAAALVAAAWLAWQADVLERPVLGDKGLNLLLSPAVSLGYVAGLVLLLRSGAGTLLSPLAATGRMAFTNYITQSLVMTSIFYGGRGALMGHVDRPGLWALTIAIWISQLIWSPLWLSRFEMGPLEWVWRSLTVGHWVPLRKRV
ncbi:DUF418 domain-containing protein [Stenotrophomonas sp. ISL-67]|uniref:DUF418 domain-containing protein n=1 Tax=Stenotrophomonas sp. ISL-67 TaxID=2819171 RepID=UPI001BEAA82F|nr:DUF418 domain-containing protein [Stenotrophomonas sp. ISL-67]MBT2767083.1 DUF418 domain-containing protein [Stenotrophomonas sp. ISL-67]